MCHDLGVPAARARAGPVFTPLLLGEAAVNDCSLAQPKPRGGRLGPGAPSDASREPRQAEQGPRRDHKGGKATDLAEGQVRERAPQSRTVSVSSASTTVPPDECPVAARSMQCREAPGVVAGRVPQSSASQHAEICLTRSQQPAGQEKAALTFVPPDWSEKSLAPSRQSRTQGFTADGRSGPSSAPECRGSSRRRTPVGRSGEPALLATGERLYSQSDTTLLPVRHRIADVQAPG